MKNNDLNRKRMLGIDLPTDSNEDILEKTLKFISSPKGNFMVMSLNPEIFVEIKKNATFKKVATEAQVKIVDGVGVVLAARLLGIPVGPRFTGVDYMDTLMKRASAESLSVMLIGGSENVAEKLVDCYQRKYPALNIFGFQGIKNISSPTPSEEKKIFSIVSDRKPQIIFLAFGSPSQELWLDSHKKQLTGIVCAGVGGAFDFLSGSVPRAPKIMRKIGLEWAYRLIMQPWRWRRQLRLITFMNLIVRERLKKGVTKTPSS